MTKRKLLVFSASQFGQADRCLAYWGWRRIRGLEEPQSTKAAVGVAIHREMELYGLLGITPTSKAGKKLAEYAPPPGMAEHEVPVSYTLAGVPFIGYIDVACGWDPRAKEYRPLEPGAPVVLVDFKSTSALRYAKDEDTLRADPAVNLYAYEAFEGGATQVYIRWLYIQADGGSRVHEVYFQLVEADVRARVLELVEHGAQLQSYYAADTDPNTLSKNREGCFAYGTRCPGFDLCERPSTKTDWDTFDEEDMPNEDFKAAMVTAFPKKAPPLPPRKAPPLPPGGLTKAPQDAEPTKTTEQLLLDAVAPERAGWDADAKPVVESGYINAPESADVPLAATPEEAAVIQGIEAPKPPEPDDLDALDKHLLKAMAVKMGMDPKTKAREPGLKAYIRAERAKAALLGADEEPPTLAESIQEAAEAAKRSEAEYLQEVAARNAKGAEVLRHLEATYCIEEDYDAAEHDDRHPVVNAFDRLEVVAEQNESIVLKKYGISAAVGEGAGCCATDRLAALEKRIADLEAAFVRLYLAKAE